MKKLLFILFFTLFFSGCQRVQTQSVPLSQLPYPSPTFFSKEIPITPKTKILFGGDLMFDRTIRTAMRKQGSTYILEPLHAFLHRYDAVIANLEGPVTSNTSKSEGSAVGSRNNYIFTFDPEVSKLLYDENIRIVNIGNNHIGNFGKDGIRQTQSFLEAGNISYFGNTGEEQKNRYIVKDIQGIHVGFVNHNQFVQNGFEDALKDIKEVSKISDVVIVYTHWGNEYVEKASGVIVDQAHKFIDAGADLIIGSHPHVTQQKEVYKGKIIYYSLGNFVFDQYFQKEVTQGMLVEVNITKNPKMIETKEFPITLQMNGQTSLLK